MRQAINNLQSTSSGLELISSENMFSVCDQPHKIIAQIILEACQKSDKDTAMEKILDLWDRRYSARCRGDDFPGRKGVGQDA